MHSLGELGERGRWWADSSESETMRAIVSEQSSRMRALEAPTAKASKQEWVKRRWSSTNSRTQLASRIQRIATEPGGQEGSGLNRIKRNTICGQVGSDTQRGTGAMTLFQQHEWVEQKKREKWLVGGTTITEIKFLYRIRNNFAEAALYSYLTCCPVLLKASASACRSISAWMRSCLVWSVIVPLRLSPWNYSL